MNYRKIALLILTCLLVSCGQTGTLYLPPTPTEHHSLHPATSHAKNSFYVGTGVGASRKF